jgi:hypothetical protein
VKRPPSAAAPNLKRFGRCAPSLGLTKPSFCGGRATRSNVTGGTIESGQARPYAFTLASTFAPRASRMEIDRRELLAGLAAAACEPWRGLGLRQARFYLPQGLFFSLSTPWSFPAFVAQYGGRWRFDPNPKGRALIQHENSGLTFRRTPQPDNPFVMEAVFIDDPREAWPDAAAVAAIGRAAVWTFVHGQSLRYLERRTGAISFRYREGGEHGDHRPPYLLEDAPALF